MSKPEPASPIGVDAAGNLVSLDATRGPRAQVSSTLVFSSGLTACATDPPPRGAVVRLDARVPVRVQLGAESVTFRLTRLVSLTAAGPRVERTAFLATDRFEKVEAALVLVGDGSVGFSTRGGVRCDRVALSPAGKDK